MGSETYQPDELDEIKVGDKLLTGTVVRDVYEVVETDVLAEMNVIGQEENEYTAGVRVKEQGRSFTRTISYRTLVESGIYTVSRDWRNLTDEQRAAITAEA